uniref:Uncharacterized protein n=1 Tax=uncultured bacterium contig00043 TaxID=1181530 RepID=A0A806JZI7_9BACT|nr:hypothetical protein [uncultured bacterium contig00043]
MIGRFGAPKMVYSARGNELWQDDVVFQYEKAPPIGAVDFFIYRDRVWQVKVASVNGIAVGEPKQSALTVLGSEAEDRADHLLMKVSDRDWPLMLRVNINNGTGRVASIYIYRIDF